MRKTVLRSTPCFASASLLMSSTLVTCCVHVRSDEIGVPYVVTVDFETAQDKSVTLRERDSMSQYTALLTTSRSVAYDQHFAMKYSRSASAIRLPIAQLSALMTGLVSGSMTWERATNKYPVVRAADEAEGDAPQSSSTANTATAVDVTASGAGVVVERNACSSFSRPKQQKPHMLSLASTKAPSSHHMC
eukprot:17589-Heterococcus_DN1.PRE.4